MFHTGTVSKSPGWLGSGVLRSVVRMLSPKGCDCTVRPKLGQANMESSKTMAVICINLPRQKDHVRNTVHAEQKPETLCYAGSSM
jgi:hypothetical protein